MHCIGKLPQPSRSDTKEQRRRLDVLRRIVQVVHVGIARWTIARLSVRLYGLCRESLLSVFSGYFVTTF